MITSCHLEQVSIVIVNRLNLQIYNKSKILPTILAKLVLIRNLKMKNIYHHKKKYKLNFQIKIKKFKKVKYYK